MPAKKQIDFDQAPPIGAWFYNWPATSAWTSCGAMAEKSTFGCVSKIYALAVSIDVRQFCSVIDGA
jgi:hypothetical protein